MSKVYICKPIPRESKRGIHEQHLQEINASTKEVIRIHPLNRTKGINPRTGESLTEVITARRNASRTRYELGLSELVPNPYKDMTVDEICRLYGLNKREWADILKDIVGEEKITLQTKAEIKFGLSPDELTEVVPPKPTKDNPNVFTRIMRHKVVLYDEANPFSDDNLNGFLAIQILKHAKDRVATSPDEINPSFHGWLLLEQSKEQKLSIDKIQRQNKAISEFNKLCESYPIIDSLENNVLYMMGFMIRTRNGERLLKGKLTPAAITERIDSFLKPSDKSLIDYNAKRFLEMVEFFKKDPNLFYVRFLSEQAIGLNLIQPSNGYYYWKSRKGTVDDNYQFSSLDNVVSYFYAEFEKDDSPNLKDLIREVKGKSGIVPSFIEKVFDDDRAAA